MSDEEKRGPSILITYPFPLGTKAAGGSRTTPEVARHLARLGADVTILTVSTNALDRRFPRTPPAPEELGPGLDEDLAEDGVKLVRVPQHPIHFQFDPYCVRSAVKRILAERRIDFVLAHYNEAGALLSLLRRRRVGFGFLATWQTYSFLARTYRGWWGKLKKWAEVRYTIRPHREADVIFAISEFTKRELVEILGCDPERIRIAPLGVRPTFTELPRPEPEEPDAIRRLLFFGRIVPEKGVLDALNALAKVEARGLTDWSFRLIGAGRPDLARGLAEELGIADKVTIEGPTDDEGLREALRRADLALLPSHAESFGLAIAEAQGAGVPVVGFAAGSVPEVCADGETGWLAPLGDVDGLADRIEEALRNPAETRERGRAARERVKRLFHWDRTARILLEGIESFV